eukprot:CAMPEP_0114118144 /NCGR_PEP_ID=MMETSP0043_2-20121206/5428_1 /TAXON_ID=464988 /ORGANISM="Hemiselmis andersenii, Strain CCMP644" /LENGTH=195 /DNA_ID=CAMNT_0001210619 /DNA_START=18 /DNA_END=605 /DNA_ORIENTATION=+
MGFTEREGEAPVPYEMLPARVCSLYRVVDAYKPHHHSAPRLGGAALALSIGPVDSDSAEPFAGYSPQLLGPMLANRLCFARSEGMDLVLLVATQSLMLGRPPHMSKLLAMQLALVHYRLPIHASQARTRTHTNTHAAAASLAPTTPAHRAPCSPLLSAVPLACRVSRPVNIGSAPPMLDTSTLHTPALENSAAGR